VKRPFFAFAMALASISAVFALALQAQESITIKDITEYNAYQMANAQSDPKAKAAALESFLQTYPQTVVKKAVLDQLVTTYAGLAAQGGADATAKELTAAMSLIQLDPSNLKAFYFAVQIKKGQGTRNTDAAALDEAAALAGKALAVSKPAATSDDDWKKLTGATYPLFHSAIAVDDAISKKDFKAAVDEYHTELSLYTPDQTKAGPGLVDTLQIAHAYTQPGAKDLVQASWFFARAWDYAPADYKTKIAPDLEYWYKTYHGNLDGLADVKTLAAANVFPPADFTIKPAPTPAERIHDMLAHTTDLKTLALSDKETILAYGSKDDADRLWALMKDQQTPVPGIVIDAPATAIKVAITQAAKTTDFSVTLKSPAACKDLAAAGSDVKTLKTFILSAGASEDTDKIEPLSGTRPITKIAIEGMIPIIKVAVTDDAKQAKYGDFVVNLKAPVGCKEVPASSTFGLQSKGDTELDGAYDTYTVIQSPDKTTQAAQIALREGFIQAEKKKPVAHQAAPARRKAH